MEGKFILCEPSAVYLDYVNAHFWSLSVEMQFYAAIALAVAFAGRSGLWLGSD